MIYKTGAAERWDKQITLSRYRWRLSKGALPEPQGGVPKNGGR